MQVVYLQQQSARRLKAGEGRIAEGVSVHSMPDGAGAGVETRLFELAPDGVLASSQGEGERHFFVVSGVGEVSAARSETSQPLNGGALLSLNPDEGFRIRNTGSKPLLLLYIRPTATPSSGEVAAEASRAAAPTPPPPLPAPPVARPQPDAPPASPPRGSKRTAAAPPVETAMPMRDDGAEGSRRFRLVFEGGADEAGKGFGNYRLYPPTIAGAAKPKPISEKLDFEEMSAGQASYMTLIHALEDLAARLQEEEQAPSDWQVDISGNQRVVIRQLQGEAKPKTQTAADLLEEATTILNQFGGYTLSFEQE